MRIILGWLLCFAHFALPASAAPLEGRWILVEQTHGAGSANRVDDVGPLELEFVREAGKLTGRIRFPAVEPTRTWPALPGLTVDVLELQWSPSGDRVRARYRTAADGDGPGLELVEEYRVGGDGRSLEGTVTVTTLAGDVARGSIVIHRRFERRR